MSRLKIEFRAAAKGDIDALVALERAAFATEAYDGIRMDRSDFMEAIHDRTNCLIVAAFQDNRDHILGYTLVDVAKDDPRSANIDSLAIAPEAAGHGVGHALLLHSEDIARTHGFPAITYQMKEDNRAVPSMRRRSGYSIVEIERDYYMDGKAALIMGKSLK